MGMTSSTKSDGAVIAKPKSVPTNSVEALDRPFHLIVVVWGERFRNYFLQYCLPSLMSPGNIPALKTIPQSKFLIATRPEDWAAMMRTPIFGRMAQYVVPHYIEIPPCPPGKSGCEHMGIGHKLACDLAYREKAYAAVLTPDCMLADGGLARLQELARSGVEVVLTAALRFGEEPLFKQLRDMGALADTNATDYGSPLTITCRQMVKAAIHSFHSHSASCEWDSSYFPHVPHCAWWRVPKEEGVLLHSLSWAPLLINYGTFSHHDTSAIEDWTIDGDYLYKNLDRMQRIHIVQDSDELFLVSWAPLSDRRIRQYPILRRKPIGGLIWRMQFKAHFEHSTFDPLKRKLFFEPIRWHSDLLTRDWDAVERRAMYQIRKLVPPASGDTRGILAATMSFALSVALATVRRMRKVVRWLQTKWPLNYEANRSGAS
jgi:hypothetical protein